MLSKRRGADEWRTRAPLSLPCISINLYYKVRDLDNRVAAAEEIMIVGDWGMCAITLPFIHVFRSILMFRITIELTSALHDVSSKYFAKLGCVGKQTFWFDCMAFLVAAQCAACPMILFLGQLRCKDTKVLS